MIPASPLALTAERKLDERRQRALWRYYIAAGAGGIAIGVHTTQFAIRDPKIGLFKPLLELGKDEIEKGTEPFIGSLRVRVPERALSPVRDRRRAAAQTRQAVSEAALLSDLGYSAASAQPGRDEG